MRDDTASVACDLPTREGFAAARLATRTMHSRSRALPYAMLLGAQVAIGGAAIFARYALEGAGPLAVSALRLALAAAVVWLFARGTPAQSARREAAFAVAGVALALHFAAWIASLQYTSVALSTVLVTTTPLWTEAFDRLRGRTWPRVRSVAGGILGFAGIGLIAAGGRIVPAPVPGHAWLGDALALAGSVAIGAYLLIVRDAAGAGDDRLATRAIVARTYAWAALALGLAALLARQGPPASTDIAAWAGILAMALVSQLLGHTALNAALRTFTPSVVAFTTLLEAPLAAVAAALIFHETISAEAATGGLLILGAVGLVLRDAPTDGLRTAASRLAARR